MKSARARLTGRIVVLTEPDTTTPDGRLAVLSAVLSFRSPIVALQVMARQGDPDAQELLEREELRVVYDEQVPR